MINIDLMYSMLQRVFTNEYQTGEWAETVQVAFGVIKNLPGQSLRKKMPRRWAACTVSAHSPVWFR